MEEGVGRKSKDFELITNCPGKGSCPVCFISRGLWIFVQKPPGGMKGVARRCFKFYLFCWILAWTA